MMTLNLTWNERDEKTGQVVSKSMKTNAVKFQETVRSLTKGRKVSNLRCVKL